MSKYAGDRLYRISEAAWTQVGVKQIEAGFELGFPLEITVESQPLNFVNRCLDYLQSIYKE